jgi:exodeoxyribonuclease V gamma subunit
MYHHSSSQAIFSNRTEQLYVELKNRLYNSSTTPFSKRIVIVPSPAMKSWLMTQMAQDPELGIAAGLEVTYLDQALKNLIHTLYPQHSQAQILSNTTQIALVIEAEIRKILLEPIDNTWKPLFDYLKITQSKLFKKTEARLITLSETLANLFVQYGKYGGELLQEWETQIPTDWQKQLWRKVYQKSKEESCWSYPYRQITQAMKQEAPSCDLQIHVFAVSFLPHLYHTFFMHLGKQLPVHYYILSPCQTFWSDILSDRESESLKTYWKRKGVAQPQQEALEEFLRDRNPLLANMGKLGREMAVQIENSDLFTEESYVLTQAALEIQQYETLYQEEMLIKKSETPLTLLETVQTDLLLLRNPDNTHKIPIEVSDHSIQVHAASTKLREMQILHDLILGIIEKHQEDEWPICPSDVMVMIPNIESYIPSIKAVFEAPDSALEAQITDLPILAANSLIQGFLHLLSLSLSRWDIASIKQMLDFPHFQKKQFLTPEDVNHIQDWMDETEVRWGADAAHRNEMLERDRNGRKMLEDSSSGTWERALEGLFSGLTEGENVFYLESTQSELLGKFALLMRSLRMDLKWLHDGTEFTLSEWAKYLRCLCETYFSWEESESDIANSLFTHFGTFGQLGEYITDVKFPFATIQHHLSTVLYKSTKSYREHILHAVRFCSMLPMRAIPAKVIVLAGMQEGVFPRQDQPITLNMLKNSKADYNPSSTDYDRFLFLEALLSSRQYFIMTYSEDASELLPSLIVTELLSYLDRAFTHPHKKPSIHCVHRHPFLPFDKSCFSNTLFPSYSERHYKAAMAFYKPQKVVQNSFIDHFLSSQVESSDHFIDVRDLLAFAKNPIKTYLNKALGIYLERPEDRQVKIDEDFHLSFLKNFQLKQNALQTSMDEAWETARLNGKLPVGPFKEVSEKAFKQEMTDLKQNLMNQGVQEIVSLSFSDKVTKPEKSSEGHWTVPPLLIKHQNQTIKITGTLPYISSEGVVSLNKEDKAEVVKTWPQLLLLSCLVKEHDIPIQPQIVFAKGKKPKTSPLNNPEKQLAKYLECFLAAYKNPIPLIPEWVPHLMEGKKTALEKEISAMIHDGFQPRFNDYVKWSMQSGELPNADEMISKWQMKAQQLFSETEDEN